MHRSLLEYEPSPSVTHHGEPGTTWHASDGLLDVVESVTSHAAGQLASMRQTPHDAPASQRSSGGAIGGGAGGASGGDGGGGDMVA